MTHVSRRQFLVASAAVGVAGIEGIVAARRAPAFAQGTRLHLLQWSHFVPAADTLFETQAKDDDRWIRVTSLNEESEAYQHPERFPVIVGPSGDDDQAGGVEAFDWGQ